MMTRFIVVVAMLVGLGLISVSYATDPAAKSAASPAAQTLSGEILKIEGENYTIKDASGKEVRIHVNKSTKTEGAVKVGDKVEAQTNPDGHATSLKAAK